MSVNGTVIKQNISKNIVKYRELAGLSQKELAKILDVTPSRISNWEQGANCPTIDILFEVCKILNVSINDIYGVYPDSNIPLSYIETEHIKKYRALDENGRQIIDTVINIEFQRTKELEEAREALKKRIRTYEEKLIKKYKRNNSCADLLAAHVRTDVEQTPEGVQHDLDIMNDDSQWE